MEQSLLSHPQELFSWIALFLLSQLPLLPLPPIQADFGNHSKLLNWSDLREASNSGKALKKVAEAWRCELALPVRGWAIPIVCCLWEPEAGLRSGEGEPYSLHGAPGDSWLFKWEQTGICEYKLWIGEGNLTTRAEHRENLSLSPFKNYNKLILSSLRISKMNNLIINNKGPIKNFAKKRKK